MAYIAKPKRLADAYALRSEFTNNQSMAFFPAEVLVRLYQVMGNVRELFRYSTLLSEALVVLGVLAGLTTWIQLLMPRFALFRAMGATKSYVLISIWGAIMALMMSSTILGLILGYVVSLIAGHALESVISFPIAIKIGLEELYFSLAVLLIASVLALYPSWRLYRTPLVKMVKVL